MTMKGQTLDDLIRDASGGSRKSFNRNDRKANTISGWSYKRKTPQGQAEILVWLHTKSLFYKIYQHQWPRFGKNRDNPDMVDVYMGKLRCLENDRTNEKQYFRGPDGRREYPPTVCPICRLQEHVRELVEAGDLKLTDELFVYEGAGKKLVLHAGGIFGGFDERYMSPEQADEVKKAGIKRPWAESTLCRKKYLFSVLDHADPSSGVQPVIESKSLGDSMIAQIATQRKQAGSKGDPMLNPYAIAWQYDQNQPGAKQYSASAVPLVGITDEIRRQIVDEPPPDVSRFFESWNLRTIWAQMEQCCTQKFDWEYIFGPALKACDDNGFYYGEGFAPRTENAPIPSFPALNGNAPVDASPDDFCTTCKAFMGAEALECAKCGTKYEAADEEIPF
jgi:hypothetical protein